MRAFLGCAGLVLAACGGSESTTGTAGNGGSTSATSATNASGSTAATGALSTTGSGGASPCGTRTGKRALTSRMLHVADLDRTYLVYLPPALDPTKPVPLVFVHHGYTMSGQAMHDITNYDALADAEGIAVAFPDGEGGPNAFSPPWNVGMNVCPTSLGTAPVATGDDFAFQDSMKADIELDQCIDSNHIFVTGFSMGGYFSHEVGCLRDDIRSVAPHSGGTHDLSNCTTGHKPIIIFHGKSDPLVYDGCDDPAGGNTPGGFTPSATAWAAHNGCAMTTTSKPVMNGTCEYFDGCPADGQVALCTFAGMGHCWAGGAANTGTFSCPGFESATQLEWDFWKQYAW
jgi:polyhydroxybutyrate depolymerase